MGRFHRELGEQEDVRYREMLDESARDLRDRPRRLRGPRTETLYEEFNEHFGPDLVATIRSYRSQD